ncbi:MAG: Ig-like domain-containing protein [Gemmatimonadales bacterium]
MRAAALSLLASAGLLAACGGGGGEDVTGPVTDAPPDEAGPRPVASVVVTPAEDILIVGETVRLVAEIRAEDGTVLTGRPVSWTTSDPDVAEVDPASGLVLAAGPGEATITATSETVEGSAALGVIAFRQVSAGSHHTCAVTTEGAAYCWGFNSFGQLGDATTTDRTRPVPVADELVFESVTAGAAHTCGLTPAGLAYCWGHGGQLGDGTTSQSGRPTAVAPAVNQSMPLSFTSLSAGFLHTCGRTTTEVGYCWGLNGAGQLGVGTTTAYLVPIQAGIGLRFVQLSAGATHTCGIATSGAAHCWGRNGNGQLGDGTTLDQRRAVAVAPPAGQSTPLVFASLDLGGIHSCGLDQAGGIYCWGSNGSGELGDGTTTSRTEPVPVEPPAGSTFAAVTAGAVHTCGLGPLGAAYCWGNNIQGQLGDGTTTHQALAVAVAPPAEASRALLFTSLSAGGTHTCGIAPLGRPYCWGDNANGQLGTGTTESSLVPIAVVSP